MWLRILPVAAVLLCGICLIVLAVPAMATMPAREDVYPQYTYSGMQIRDMNFSGLTITSSYEPGSPPEVKTISGRIDGDVVRVQGTIIYNSLDPGEWSVYVRQGERTATNGSTVRAENYSAGKAVPFDVCLELGPGAATSGTVSININVTTHATSADATVAVAGLFYGSSVPVPSSTPRPGGNGNSCLPALLMPLVIAGAVFTVVRSGK
jgi:hypothetical protein